MSSTEEMQIQTPAITHHYRYNPTTPLSPQSTTLADDETHLSHLKTIQNLQDHRDILKLPTFLSSDTFHAFQDAATTIKTTPCLLLDLDMVAKAYDALTTAFPYGSIYFAIKANPAPEITKLLVEKGSSFDVASTQELDQVLSAGLPPHKVSYGNTIKKAKDIAYFFSKGVRLFVCDNQHDLHNLAKDAPGSRVYTRILLKSYGHAEWPLSKKFGCEVEMAKELLIEAHTLGLVPCGVSFHVGSQQTDPRAWEGALTTVGEIFEELYDQHGIKLDLVDLGGGLTAHYTIDTDPLSQYSQIITTALDKCFPPHLKPTTVLLEPGRSLVGNAGVLIAEVIMKTQKCKDGEKWLYVDTGIYNGAMECLGEAIKYPILAQQVETGALALCSYVEEQEQYENALMSYYSAEAAHDKLLLGATSGDNNNDSGHDKEEFCSAAQYAFSTTPREAVILAGPTCDSVDVLYKDHKYRFPQTLQSGDRIWLISAGAYIQSCAAVGFNGFPSIQCHCISSSQYAQQQKQQQKQ